MNKLKLMLPLLLLILAACHHDTPNTQTQITNTSPALGPSIPSGAAGALYAISAINYDNSGSGYDTTNIGQAYAWFGNYTTTQNAGSVVVTGDSLYITDPNSPIPYATPWYEASIFTPFSYSSNTVVWGVQGNSANGIPAINYTDNTVFPVVTGLAISYPVVISSPITVHFTVSGAYDYIFYSISGSGTQPLNFTGTTGATSATFTAAQLAQVASSGGELSIEIMPVKLTPNTVSGKTYYFVKQAAYSVSSMVQ